MTPEERQLIDDLFMRMREASTDDRDREAEGHINQLVRQSPLAPYLLTQTVLVLEQNAEEQAHYIQDLEARIQELEQSQRGGQGGSGGGGGFLGRGRSVSTPSMQGRRDDQTYDARYEEPQGRPTPSGSGIPQIGSRAGEYSAPYGQGGGRPPVGSPFPQQSPPGIPPQQPPQAQAPSGGGGFLKTALATAAAVAGGVLVMDALKGVMGGGGANANNANPGQLNDQNNDPADYQSSTPSFNDDNNDPGGDL